MAATCQNNEASSKPTQKSVQQIGETIFQTPITQATKFRRAGFARCAKKAGQLYGNFYTTSGQKVFAVYPGSSMPSATTIRQAWKRELDAGQETTIYWPRYRIKFFLSEIQEYFGGESQMTQLFLNGQVHDGQNFDPKTHWFTESLATDPTSSQAMVAWLSGVYTPDIRKSNKTKVVVKLNMTALLVKHTDPQLAKIVKPERPKRQINREVSLEQTIFKYFAKLDDFQLAVSSRYGESEMAKEYGKALSAYQNQEIYRKGKARQKAPKPFVPFGAGKPADGKRYLMIISFMTDNRSSRGIKIGWQKQGALMVLPALDKLGKVRQIEVMTTYLGAWEIFLNFYAPYAADKNLPDFNGSSARQIYDRLINGASSAARLAYFPLQGGLHVKAPKGQKGQKGARSPRSNGSSPIYNPLNGSVTAPGLGAGMNSGYVGARSPQTIQIANDYSGQVDQSRIYRGLNSASQNYSGSSGRTTPPNYDSAPVQRAMNFPPSDYSGAASSTSQRLQSPGSPRGGTNIQNLFS